MVIDFASRQNRTDKAFIGIGVMEVAFPNVWAKLFYVGRDAGDDERRPEGVNRAQVGLGLTNLVSPLQGFSVRFFVPRASPTLAKLALSCPGLSCFRPFGAF